MNRAAVDLSTRLQTPRILWGALLASTVVLLVVLFIQKQSGTLPATPASPVMLPALAVVAVMTAAISIVLPRQMQQQALKQARFEVTTEADPDAVGMFRDAAPTIRVFADSSKVTNRVVPIYQTGLILGLALSEAVSLFGFVLGMLGFELPYILPFWIVSWLLIAIRFPTQARVLGPVTKAYDAQLR